MRNFNEKYKERQFISRDEFSDTYRTVNSVTKDIVTLKILVNQNEEQIKSIKSAIKILKEMENPHLIVINSMSSFREGDKSYYYIECEDFNSKNISNQVKISEFTSVEIMKILKQVAEGLKEFHFKSITYKNLSSENIYIDNNGVVKLDTIAYLENINSKEDLEEELNEEDDIFSLGVILFELVTGNSKFKLGKYKNEVSDLSLVNIIDRATNRKVQMYRDLNEFISDAEAYIEYGGTSSESYDAQMIEIEDEFENDYYQAKPKKIIKRIIACVAVLLIMITAVKGVSLLNGKKDDATQIASEKVTEPEKQQEIIEEEKEEIVEEEDIENITEEYPQSISYDDTYDNQEEYNNTSSSTNNNVNSSISNSNSTNNNSINSSINSSSSSSNSSNNTNNYRPNNNSSSNNSNSNSSNNNTNNNVQSPSNGGSSITTPEDGESGSSDIETETPQPEINPEDTPNDGVIEESTESQYEGE